MKIEGIIFDKDGTLMDFDAFWVTLSKFAISDVLSSIERTDIPLCEILEAFGVSEGATNSDGILYKGTYGQMAQAMQEVLKKYGCFEPYEKIKNLVISAYGENAHKGEVKPTCENLKQVLTSLKKRGVKLAVVTVDNEKSTRFCLEKLDIKDLFDKIYSDDGKISVKPNPFCANDFCKNFGIEKENAVMVGDSLTDAEFAQNSEIKMIGVSKTTIGRKLLEPFSYKVINDPSGILEI